MEERNARYYHQQAHSQVLTLFENGPHMRNEEIQNRLRTLHRTLNDMLIQGQGRRPRTQPQPRARAQPRPVVAAPVARRRPIAFETSKALSKAAIEANCSESCAICMETHKKSESILTQCGHEFGKMCYASWINAPNGNFSCPTCRKFCPTITSFRPRAARQKKTPTVVASEELERLAMLVTIIA